MFLARSKVKPEVAAEVKSTTAVIGETLINVLFDNNVAGLDERQARSQSTIGDYMAADLIRVIARYSKKGFHGKLLTDGKGLKMVNSEYLLKVKIVKYRAVVQLLDDRRFWCWCCKYGYKL